MIGAGETAQQFRAPIAPTEDPGFFSSTYMAAYNVL